MPVMISDSGSRYAFRLSFENKIVQTAGKLIIAIV